MGEAARQELAHRCIICEQEKEAGIIVITEFICEDCEDEMVRTDVSDARYSFFISQMKRIFINKNA